MREEPALAELGALARDAHASGERDAREIAPACEVVGREAKRHEPRTRRHDAEAESLRDPIAEVARTELRNREAARRDDERVRFEASEIRLDREAPVVRDLADRAADENLDAGRTTLREEQLDHLARAPVAEELAERLFVPGDAVAVDERDEVVGPVARERRARKIGIRGKKVLRADDAVREVAAAAAGDLDLPADPCLALGDDDAPAALAGLDRAEEAGGAAAEDDGVERSGYFTISRSSTSNTSGEFGLIFGGAPRSL